MRNTEITTTTPLVFQQDRGPGSQDSLYRSMGYRFILAPNRYRKLVGKTPYELSKKSLMALKLEKALEQRPDITEIEDLSEYACKIELPEPVLSSGMRMFGLTTDELVSIQTQAIALMKADWPEYAEYVVGYEPHINLFDEILIWRTQ